MEATGVAIVAVTAVDAPVSDAAVDGVAAVVQVRQGREPRVGQAGVIFRPRNTLHHRAISAETNRAETNHAATSIAAIDPIKADAPSTIAATVAIVAGRDVSIIAGPRADRGLLHRRGRAAKKKFCYPASRSQNIARVPRQLLRQRRSSSTSRTTSRNRTSMNQFPAALGCRNLRTRRVAHPAFRAGCSQAPAPKLTSKPNLPKVHSKVRHPQPRTAKKLTSSNTATRVTKLRPNPR